MQKHMGWPSTEQLWAGHRQKKYRWAVAEKYGLANLENRDPVFYFGFPSPDDPTLVVYTKTGFYKKNVVDGTTESIGLNRVDSNISYDNEFSLVERENWVAPLRMLAPLSCTAILASQYFVFY